MQREDRMGRGEADPLEAGHDHHDLRRQQHAAKDLQPRHPGPYRRAQPSGPARGQHRHEGGEQPVADHDEELGRVEPGQVFRGAVLHREGRRRDQRETDAP